jgi:hypothetical protein
MPAKVPRREGLPEVTIGIASINTRMATELCLRSLEAHDAGKPYHLVVGDCGSTDGTLPMLIRRLRANMINELELAPRGRLHAQWVDHWVNNCWTPYLFTLDSDVEIRADGWLQEMLDHLGPAGACAASITPENLAQKSPIDGLYRHVGRKLSMHCALFDLKTVRALGRSFLLVDLEDPHGGGLIRYDVGGWVTAGLDVAVMPAGWEASHIVHYGAMSWAKEQASDPTFRRRWIRSQVSIAGRYASYRVGGRRAAEALTAAGQTARSLRRTMWPK